MVRSHIPLLLTIASAGFVVPAAADTPTTTAGNTPAAAPVPAPYKPPHGYRMKIVGGEKMYCSKTVVVGSRFAKEICMTQEQLVDLKARETDVQRELSRGQTVCAGGSGCASQ